MGLCRTNRRTHLVGDRAGEATAQGWAWLDKKMCSVVWVAGCMSHSRVFPCERRQRSQRHRAKTIYGPWERTEMERERQLQPPRRCSCRRITFGNETRRARGLARCAIKFVENCQPRNMNGEITGKSHFRVCRIQTRGKGFSHIFFLAAHAPRYAFPLKYRITNISECHRITYYCCCY